MDPTGRWRATGVIIRRGDCGEGMCTHLCLWSGEVAVNRSIDRSRALERKRVEMHDPVWWRGGVRQPSLELGSTGLCTLISIPPKGLEPHHPSLSRNKPHGNIMISDSHMTCKRVRRLNRLHRTGVASPASHEGRSPRPRTAEWRQTLTLHQIMR